VPSISTTGAMLAGMQRLGAQTLVVATPYTDERNALLRQYLEGQGYSVAATRGLGFTRAVDIARLPFDRTYELACAAAESAPEADAIYMPCARMPVVRNIERIEASTGKPVVTSTQAMVWWGLRAVGLEYSISGFGRLLHAPTPVTAG
jgi:maleate isomerase